MDVYRSVGHTGSIKIPEDMIKPRQELKLYQPTNYEGSVLPNEKGTETSMSLVQQKKPSNALIRTPTALRSRSTA